MGRGVWSWFEQFGWRTGSDGHDGDGGGGNDAYADDDFVGRNRTGTESTKCKGETFNETFARFQIDIP